MKIIIIDGQGGRIGKTIVEKLKQALPNQELLAIGTNAMATLAMIKAGADKGATGENPVIVNSRDADIILGPLGILSADSLLGEITETIALAIGKSKANKVLIPVKKCGITIVCTSNLSLGEHIDAAVSYVIRKIK